MTDSKKSIDDYESLDELIESQIKRKDHLSEVIKLVQDQKFLEDDIKYAYNLVGKIKNDVVTVQGEVKRMKKLHSKLNELDDKVKHIESKMSHVESNLPAKFNKLLALDDDYDKENDVSIEPICKNTMTPLPIRRHLDFTEGVMPSAQKVFVHKDIQYLTQPEFAKIPGYMRGRVTYDTINSFIDKINQCVEEKYSLIHTAKSGPKKRSELDKISMYRKQDCPKTKGKRFITQEDLKSTMGGKLDKHTLNLIPMLRHTSRLQEVRVGGLVKYIPVIDHFT